MSTDVVRKSSWILTVSLAAVAIVYLTLMWLPSQKKIRAVQEQVRTKRQFVTKATALTNTLTASQKELLVAEAAAKKWAKSAPRNRDLPALYGKINAMAKDSGLAVTRFDPEPFVVHEEIREIPLSIGCTGAYSQVFDFLRDIEGLPMSIWVEALRLEKTTASSGNIKCEINLVVFSDNPQSSDYILQAK